MMTRWGKNDVAIKLSNTVPLSLSLDGGAADMTLDLTGVLAKRVDINTGATKLALTMSEVQDGSSVSIDAQHHDTENARCSLRHGYRTHHEYAQGLHGSIERHVRIVELRHRGKKATVSINAGASTINVDWR